MLPIKILTTLAPDLLYASRIVEKLVLRTKDGSVFSIDIGENALQFAKMAYGAKVTLLTNPPKHIGICEGASVEAVSLEAQKLVAGAIGESATTDSIPKPHFPQSMRSSA